MSFGDVSVDGLSRSAAAPGRAMLTGLIGSAMGLDFCDSWFLNQLQDSLLFASREDRRGEAITDYQTVDLSQPHMQQGWTTRGGVEGRWGGSSHGTHIRHREMICGGAITTVLSMNAQASGPSLDQVAAALKAPARALFIGRKRAIPSAPVFVDLVEGRSLMSILRSAPPLDLLHEGTRCWVPGRAEAGCFPVYDRRDWSNQIHTGRSWVRIIKYGDLDA